MKKNDDPYGVHKQVQDFYNLPEWLQELWILDRPLARKAENEFKHLEQKLKQKDEEIQSIKSKVSLVLNKYIIVEELEGSKVNNKLRNGITILEGIELLKQ